MAKTSLDVFSLSGEQVWTFSDWIYEMRCPFVAVGLNATGPHASPPSHIILTPGRPVMFRGPSFIVSTMQGRTTPIFKRLWYDWTQQQPGIEPTNPLGQCWVPPIVAFYDQQGLLRTYLLPGGSIRSPHPGSPRGCPVTIHGEIIHTPAQPPSVTVPKIALECILAIYE